MYSTLLWFMKKEGSLSSVALDLVELDRSSPEVSVSPMSVYIQHAYTTLIISRFLALRKFSLFSVLKKLIKKSSREPQLS